MVQPNPAKLLLLTCLGLFWLCNAAIAQSWNPNYSVGTATGKYAFNYNQTPDQLIEIVSPVYTATTLTYQWEKSTTPVTGFTAISGATQSSYTIPGPLTQTTYYRRKAIKTATDYLYSNIVEIQVVSVNWENLNYVREHNVITTNITTDWKAVDQLAIGSKLQTTTYLDGLGRPVEQVSKQTATPAAGSSTWGDMVQFSQYDVYGRKAKEYLPYTTTSAAELGKYKTAPLTEQPSYYTTVYNETSAFSNITFENSPLSRVTKVNAPGTSWATSAGNQQVYDLNDATDNVQVFTIGYNSGDIPFDIGVYSANTLFKTTAVDENGKKVIEYSNKAGQLILKKVQIDNAPTAAHTGWICTYYIYDDFGLLRYVLQPEAVKYLDANSWSFAGTNGQAVLNELCFRYEYDDKGRTILKKAPGAYPLLMVYDSRDRVVFMQDGNQAAKYSIINAPATYAEWTFNLYDELDRVTVTGLYKTSESRAQLQSDIDNATVSSTVSIDNTGEPIIDLIVDNRNTSISTYSASRSITFTSDDGGSFQSVTNDNFTAQIDANAATPTVTTTVTIYGNPISSADLNNPSVTTILKYQYYDDYSFTGVKTFDNNFHNTTAYSTNDPNVIPIASSKRTLSYPTGSMVRVLGTNTFLNSTEYYDEKGRHVQTLEDNIKQGQDITTMQYHWDGRLLSNYSSHSTAYSGYTNFGILTKNIFDAIGRISSVQKKYESGSNDFKTIASYDYDDMGRLKTKHLDPGYTGSGKNEMESLTYSYNLHNEITGINKDYALKTAGVYSKWGNFFGMYLGYDNRDNVFLNAKLDGHVTGIVWTTQGDDAQRKYDFTYDNAGRFTSAIFKQKEKTTDAWDNSKVDFSVVGTGGKVTYDLNGNILTMTQKGVIPGTPTPVLIDQLVYTYQLYSNKLAKVKDNTPQTSTNGQSNDFKDGTNGASDDYIWDFNGNLSQDNNKAVSGINYNFLDKPELITITGKGTIKIVYDAEGNKLQKIFTPTAGTSVTTTYINQFVYKDNALQYVNFEEGRIRVMAPVSTGNGYDALIIDGNMSLPNSKEGVYDYFIRDYQENVRMILTEEIHTGSNKCTMETTRAGDEEPVFGQTGAANEVALTRSPKPSAWANNTSNSASKLGSTAAGKIGPNAFLKVMAGDVITASVDYYYQNNVTNTTGNNLTGSILSSLISVLTGSGSAGDLVKGQSANINTQLSGNSAFTGITAPDANNATGNNPKGYLTILFFDERFNYLSDGTPVPLRVTQSGNGAQPLVMANIQAPKNGYAFVYVSNESNEPVYFDNLNVALNRGRIIEEDHYYAYGLKIAAISSQKLPDPNEGNIDNKNLYNDKEFFDDADLDWYDYGFRNYDAQIGRFTQLDPLTWEYPELTNYQYASDEPIANIDVDGLEGSNAVVTQYATKEAYEAAKKAFVTDLHEIAGVTVQATLKSVAKSGVNLTNIGIHLGTNAISPSIIDNTGHKPLVPQSVQIRSATVQAYTPGIGENWSNSQSFFGKLTYSITDDIWVTTQGIWRSPSERRHIGGGTVSYSERLNAFGTTLSLLIPIGGEAKAGEKGLQILEKGIQTTENATTKSAGKTVLGHVEDDIAKVATENGAKYFKIPKEFYNNEANRKFLDRLIKRGDDVILTRARGKIEPGRVLDWEVKYLMDRGYQFVDDFKLVKVK